ncbi:MAG: hypothetical protein IJG56_02525 [Clostridia bacterium]|nr:hypothetical protein [Clostridia bacterium]MBQ6000699.1 hypothetical protein [Clostridia bacterium]
MGPVLPEKEASETGKAEEEPEFSKSLNFYRYYTIIQGEWESDFHEKSHQKNGCFEVAFCGKIFEET